MQQVSNLLSVGNQEEEEQAEGYAVVYAAKTFHQKALGYTKSLPADDESYLIYQDGENLYLNLVDMAKEFSAKFTDPIFESAVNFIRNRVTNGQKVLIICNQGKSRSPSIAMVYMAIRGQLNSISYDTAAEEFKEIYHEYEPGEGIRLYLQNNWAKLMEM